MRRSLREREIYRLGSSPITQWSLAVKKVDELKAAAGDKWEATRKDADAALDEYKKSVEG